MEQARPYRVMDGGEWALLLIFTYFRATYLHAVRDSDSTSGGWIAVVIALVLGSIPIVNIGVLIWGLYAMHQVYGCRTSGIVVAVYAAVIVLLLAIVFAAA